MKTLHQFQAIVAGALGMFLFAAASSFASAQAQPLPTAPGAEKAVTEGPPSQAQASLPAFGGSPLEPWLIVWLLPASGILAVAVATATDRAVRAGRF